MAIPLKILTRKDEIAADFFQLVEVHLTEILSGKVTEMYHIKDFAAALFIHPTHFSNTIKLATGYSPCHFLEVRTMEEARKMLADPSLSIAEIGYRLTFSGAYQLYQILQIIRRYYAQAVSETIAKR